MCHNSLVVKRRENPLVVHRQAAQEVLTNAPVKDLDAHARVARNDEEGHPPVDAIARKLNGRPARRWVLKLQRNVLTQVLR